MLMRVGQVRPCQACQRFYYSLQLAWRIPSATYPRLPIQVVTFGCRLTKKVLSSALGWDRQSYSVIARATVVLVRLMTLLGLSPSSNMDEFTSTTKLLLSVSFKLFYFYFYFLFTEKVLVLPIEIFLIKVRETRKREREREREREKWMRGELTAL